MNKVKRGLSNQAVGFIPLLAFLVIDNFLNYQFSFIFSIVLSLVSVLFYRIFAKAKIYQFSLIPSCFVFLVYALFLVGNISPSLFARSSLLIEAIMGVTLLFLYLLRGRIITRVNSLKKYSSTLKTNIRNSLNEFFYICSLFLTCYFIHSNFLLIFFSMEKQNENSFFSILFFDYMPGIIGILILIYELIRVKLIKDTLNKEIWLPVLNEKGKVIGSMAKSVSEQSSKKYIHPVIRIAVMFQGMFYLAKRKEDEYVSPGQLDYPLSGYVFFQETIQDASIRMMGNTPELSAPRHMLTYSFENNKVKQLVSLFLLKLDSEEQINKFHNGKLWTTRQIEDNLESNLFSEYFTIEYPYLQNTVLFVENLLNEQSKGGGALSTKP